ncbi:MAG: hypothetical protein HRU19_04770 [Pseudobacteriovorax sp.]|nr:hypothetical protein [Pseudobacteriovorax sp.]
MSRDWREVGFPGWQYRPTKFVGGLLVNSFIESLTNVNEIIKRLKESFAPGDGNWALDFSAEITAIRESLRYFINMLPYQHNSATKRLAYILYNSPRATIVSHSQGCVITRNAMFTMRALFGEHEKIRKNTYWLCVGSPLHSSEYVSDWIPSEGRFHRYSHPADPITSIVAGGGNIKHGLNMSAHGFKEIYVERIQPDPVSPLLLRINNANYGFSGITKTLCSDCSEFDEISSANTDQLQLYSSFLEIDSSPAYLNSLKMFSQGEALMNTKNALEGSEFIKRNEDALNQDRLMKVLPSILLISMLYYENSFEN